MVRMDLSTKQVFLSGFLAFLLTIGGGAMLHVKTQENHDVRIAAVEEVVKKNSVSITEFKAENAKSQVILETLNHTVKELSKTSTKLGEVVTRLDERSKLDQGR